jgi:hypothetical protein
MATIAARLEQAYPDANKGWASRVEPLKNVVVGAPAGRCGPCLAGSAWCC